MGMETVLGCILYHKYNVTHVAAEGGLLYPICVVDMGCGECKYCWLGGWMDGGWVWVWVIFMNFSRVLR